MKKKTSKLGRRKKRDPGELCRPRAQHCYVMPMPHSMGRSYFRRIAFVLPSYYLRIADACTVCV